MKLLKGIQHHRASIALLIATTGFAGHPQSVFAQTFDRPTYSSPIAISGNDRLIWVVNPSDNSVSVIRPDNNTRITKIAVVAEPQSIALTPDGQYAWVANTGAGTVTAIKIN